MHLHFLRIQEVFKDLDKKRNHIFFSTIKSGRTKKLLKSYKTEINPTPEQKQIISRTIGACRYIYNFYLAHNKEIYDKEKKFVSAMDFSKWLNNEFIPDNPEYCWIKEVSSKSVKQSI